MCIRDRVGTVVFRKSSHYADVAVDFVPVDEGRVDMERAADYFPVRKNSRNTSNKRSKSPGGLDNPPGACAHLMLNIFHNNVSNKQKR